MTLDEGIERYTSNAEYERTHGSLQGCLEFRQLAEWLKDYKRLKEQESIGHWIIMGDRYIKCSKCGHITKTESPDIYNFCMVCGAKMTESEVSDTDV